MTQDITKQIYNDLLARHLGRGAAVKAKILADQFHTNLREVNEAIRILRKEGRLIGSSKEPPFGYYIPASHQEREEYLNAFKQELFDMLQTFRAQKRARKCFLERQVQTDLFPVSGQAELIGI